MSAGAGWIAGAGMAADAAQAVIGGVGTILGGQLAKKVAEENAEMIRRMGKERVAQARKAGREVIGAQIAHRGASGVTMSGSSLDVLEHDAVMAEKRALNVRFATDMAAINEEFGGRMAGVASMAEGIATFGEGASRTILSGARLYGALQEQRRPVFRTASYDDGGVPMNTAWTEGIA